MRHHFVFIFFALFLTSCGTVSPTQKALPPATGTLPFTHLPPTLNVTISPTETFASTLPSIPADAIEPTPNSAQLTILNKLRMVYTKDGNLYIQDGANLPIQLTHSGQDYVSSISDDGEKIVFYRGKRGDINSIYSINANGSQEQPMVTNNILTALNLGYTASTEPAYPTFVPGTHLVLFNTQEFVPGAENPGKLSNDLLLIDADSAKVKRLLSPGEVLQFDVSPNGKLIAIQTLTQIKVIDLAGRVLRHDLITFPPGWELDWIPFCWTQDSNQLIILLPMNWDTDTLSDGPDPRIIQKFPLNGGSMIEIRLNPPPIGNTFNISPDGNWIAYNYFYYQGKTDETISAGIYLGNLLDGSSQMINTEYLVPYSFKWSPDNLYFAYESGLPQQLYLGNVNGTNSKLPYLQLPYARFLDWIDGNHYFYQGIRIFLWEIGNDAPFALDKSESFDTFIFIKHK